MATIDKRRFTARVNRPALQLAMKFHGYSLREVAMSAGVSPATIGHLASGERSHCNPETAAKIARALKVETGSIFLLKPIHDTEASIKAA